MTKAHLPSISTHTARIISFKQLEAWSATGAGHRDELKRIVKEIIRALNNSSSPSKTLNSAMKKLEIFFSRSEVRGEVKLLNNRHINFRLAFPSANEDALLFCLLYGEINARTGALKLDLTTPFQISLHALQRLFERLEENSESSVLDEIFSCIGQVIPWHKGATEVEAKCWPLISKNGFFIGISKNESSITSVVTWIKNGPFGKKWRLPIASLLRLKQNYPQRLEDHNFVKEFIRSFPWMLHENVPGEDLQGLAWEQRDGESEESNDLFTSEQQLKFDVDREINPQPKLSISYLAGLNYKQNPPPFKVLSQHTGFVVHKGSGGHLIVGLKNGWVGFVPVRSIERGVKLIAGYVSPEVGDDITVSIHKITYFDNELAYSVSLDPKEISDADWAETEKEHPIGKSFTGQLIKKHKNEFIAKLNSGMNGFVPEAEIQIYLNQPELYKHSPLDLVLELSVTGYRVEKRHLLLSIKNIELISKQYPQIEIYQIGSRDVGRCVHRTPHYAILEMPKNHSGLLHKFNNWGNELPKLDAEVEVVVFGKQDSRLLLAGIPPRLIEKYFYVYSITDDKWEEFKNKYSVGDSIEVQALFWQESTQCYVVSTSTGIYGVLSPREIDQFCSSREEQMKLLMPGDIFNAKITKIHPTKKLVSFSKKAVQKNATLDKLSKIDFSLPLNSVVVKKVDYGYFLELKPFGIPALLHRSKIPKEKFYSIGENLQIYIDTVDEVKMRVAVRLAVFDEISRLDFKIPINSVVINEVEFGYFLELESLGVRALLHRSNIPEGTIFAEGDSIDVYIDTVDKVSMRVAVKLTTG